MSGIAVDRKATTITWVERAGDPSAPTVAEIAAGVPINATVRHLALPKPTPIWHAVIDLLPRRT